MYAYDLNNLLITLSELLIKDIFPVYQQGTEKGIEERTCTRCLSS